MFSDHQRGLSLVELLVALAINLIMILGVTYVYLGSRATFSAEDNLARMQESARLAFEYLSRDIRQAGDFGCASIAASSATFLSTKTGGACSWPTDKVPTIICTLDGTGCTDVGAITPIQGFDASVPAGVTALSGTDSVAIASAGNPCEGRGGAVSTLTINQDVDNSGVGSKMFVNASGTALATCLQAGDVLVATNCKNATVFQACGIASDGVVFNEGNSGGCSSIGNKCKGWGNEYKGGSLLRLSRYLYYVKDDAGVPTLYRRNMISSTEEALVPNIENLQIRYGVAPTVDDYPTSYQTAAGVTDWKLVKSVRIEALVRSADDNVSTDTQSVYFNGATLTPTDKRLRLVIGSTISIRNRTLLSTK